MQFVEEVFPDEVVFYQSWKVKCYFKGNIAELKTKNRTNQFEHAIAAISTHNKPWLRTKIPVFTT